MVKIFIIVFLTWFSVAFFPWFIKSWIINIKIKKAAKKANRFDRWMF